MPPRLPEIVQNTSRHTPASCQQYPPGRAAPPCMHCAQLLPSRCLLATRQIAAPACSLPSRGDASSHPGGMASEQARLLPGVVALNVAPPEDTGAAPAKQHVKPGLWKLLAVWCRLARLWFTGTPGRWGGRGLLPGGCGAGDRAGALAPLSPSSACERQPLRADRAGSDRYLAWKLALASLALSVATSLILLKLSYVQNDLSSALAEKQQCGWCAGRKGGRGLESMARGPSFGSAGCPFRGRGQAARLPGSLTPLHPPGFPPAPRPLQPSFMARWGSLGWWRQWRRRCLR